MTFSCEGNSLRNFICLYVPDKITDIRARDKCLARTLEDNRLDIGIFLSLGKPLFKLGKDIRIQRVHGLGAVDDNSGDAVFHLKINHFEIKRRSFLLLFYEYVGHLEVGILLCNRFDKFAGLVNADFVHNFKRAHDPPKADLCAPVGVFNGGDTFIHKCGRNPETYAVESLSHCLNLGFIHFALKVPVFFFLHLGFENFSWRVKGTQFVTEGGGGVNCDGDAGDVHKQKWTHADFKPAFRAFLNGGNAGDAFFKHPGGFIQKRNKEAVDCKSRGVFHKNGGFAVKLCSEKRSFNGFPARAIMGNHFKKTVFCRVEEIVKPDKPVRPGDMFNKISDIKA